MESNYTQNKRTYYLTTTLVVLCFLVAGIGLLKETYSGKESLVASVEEAPIINYINPYENVSVVARSAYVLDLNTSKVLYEKNATDILPLASLTKIMTVLTAIEIST